MAIFEYMKPLRYLVAIAIVVGCKVPQSSPDIKKQDTIFAVQKSYKIDSYYIEVHDTIPSVNAVQLPCPPQTIINAKRVRKSGNIDNSVSIELKNCFNENNDLKKSNQVYKSQVDSLIMATNKGNGNQSNTGDKWWKWLLVGMALGVVGYQGIRSAITKKL